MRIKVSSQALSRAAGPIKEQRVFREINEISKKKRVLPISFLTVMHFSDGYRIVGRDKNGPCEYEAASIEEALDFLKDNL